MNLRVGYTPRVMGDKRSSDQFMIGADIFKRGRPLRGFELRIAAQLEGLRYELTEDGWCTGIRESYMDDGRPVAVGASARWYVGRSAAGR